MKLADQMLLAQIREKLLGHIDDGQWRMIETEVENAGGVKETEGYAGTILKDAVNKASFGGDRSAAGRFAAEQRWKGQGKRTAETQTGRGKKENRNPNLPPLYQDYGDEPGDAERGVAGLRAMTTPLDINDPKASEARKTPESIAKDVKTAPTKLDASTVVNRLRSEVIGAEMDLKLAKDSAKRMKLTEEEQRQILGVTTKERLAEAKDKFAQAQKDSNSAKKAFREKYGQDVDAYWDEEGWTENPYKGI